MVEMRAGALLAAGVIALAACSSDTEGGDQAVALPDAVTPADETADTPLPTSTVATTIPATTTTATSTTSTTTTTTSPTTTVPAPVTTLPAPTTTSPTSTTTPPSTTTTTIPLPPDVFDAQCVVVIQSGDSLGLIADRFDDPTVTPETLRIENGIEDGDVIYAGNLLDVCVGNGLNDVTGEERVAADDNVIEGARAATVQRQQTKLNELFAGLGIRDLLVDGISGPVTKQRLCAARAALDLPVNRADMPAGSDEEQALMEAVSLPPPFTTALLSERWVMIDRTCQIMFVGAGTNGISYVFPTSTGEAGHETRDQDRSRAFRYDPAIDNGGWHNSSTFPVAIDNPLNGNMYRPLYFDGGQAIHGSNNVPSTPQSKGCARLRIGDQDTLISWLGLNDLPAPTWSQGRINVTVNVQGVYTPG